MEEPRTVFDCQEARYRTRQQITRHTGVLLTSAVLLVGSAWMIGSRSGRPSLLLISFCGFWVLPIGYATYRIYVLSHVVWCIKLYADRLVGYDYARRKMALSWNDMQAIDLGDAHLRAVNREGTTMLIPESFSQFSVVSHRVLDHAEHHAVPIYINGQALDALNPYELFPFLEHPEQTPH